MIPVEMAYAVVRKGFIIWLLVSGLSGYGLAQRPSREQLQATLQHLSAQVDLRDQTAKLQAWQQQWQRAGYPPDSVYIDGLLALGLAHLYRNAYPASMQAVRQAVRLCQARRPNVAADQPAKALYRLGMLLVEQSLPAMDTLKQAVQQGQGIPSASRWVGYAYLYLSYVYYSVGDFQQALTSAETGEQLVVNTNDRPLLTKLLHEKANALNQLEQYRAARQVAEQAVLLSKRDGYPALIARTYQLLGTIAQNQHQLPAALQYYKRAFDIAESTQDVTAPNYAVSLGMLYDQLGRYNQAIPYFRYGVDKNTNAYAKAFALSMLGRVDRHKKAYSRALQYYQRGLMMLPLGFRNPTVTSLPSAKSIRQADQKDYLLTLTQDKADTWLDSAKASMNRQCLGYALETYKVADQMIDYMRWEHTGEQSKLYWREKTRGLYERAIETCYRLGDVEQAFRFFEKSRAVMLADKLNELGARQQLSPAQIKQEKALREAISEQQNKFADVPPDNGAYGSIQQALLLKQDRLEAFIKQLEQSNPAYYRYKYDNSIPSLKKLQGYLGARGASFVTYFVGDSALYLLSVTGGQRQLVRLRQPVGDYKQTVKAFMALLTNPDALNRKAGFDRFLRLGHNLYDQLLAPLHLPSGGRLIVSPDRFLVPFDALSRSADKPAYLVKNYAFDYVYSARLLLKRDIDPTPGVLVRSFLGVAPVSFAASLGQVSLPGSDKALLTIGERFSRPTLFTGKDATRRAFLAGAANARIIHLFTHAVADSTEREPLLYFADSTLRLSELGDGDLLNARLAVLGACKTGVGVDQVGEGVFSLARGFASLGVPSVVSTLWSVQDQATYTLSNLFYQYLDEGLPKDLALQRAKQDWLNAAQGTDQLPNAWAGMIILGDAEPLDQPSRWPWLAGSALLLGGGLLVWRLKRRAAPDSRI